MDKKKSEKLKQILNQTLSSEEIENKLKDEIKNNAQKKIKEKKKRLEEKERAKKIYNEIDDLETEIKKEEIQESSKRKDEKEAEEVIVPSIREKKKVDLESNLVLYLVSIIAILLLILAIYLYTKDNVNTTQTLTNQNIEKEVKIDNPKVKETPRLDTEKTIDEKISETKPKIKKDVVLVEKPKEIIKEKIVTKIVKLDKKNFKDFYNSSKYNTLKCYNFKAGDIFPDTQCKTEMKKFLNVNKNALRFEIIPVIAENDSIIFNKMKSNLNSLENDFQKKVKEYMFRGLSRERVLETSWQVKDFLGEDTILTPTNYYVKSKKNNRGIIIKAYH